MSEEILEFDVRDVIAERRFPEGSVEVWFTEDDYYLLRSLNKKLADETDEKAVKALEKQHAEVTARIYANAYTVRVRGITNRANEDLISKALAAFPIKRDMLNREEPEQIRLRNNHIQHLLFAAHITKIVAPNGAVQNLTPENALEVIDAVFAEAPKSVCIDRIDAAIAAVNADFADELQRISDPSF